MDARIVHNGDTVIVSQRQNVVTVSSGITSGKPYTGSYEATPSRSVQIFKTAKLTMRQDFMVHPIPSNYGLIEYDGSKITVS